MRQHTSVQEVAGPWSLATSRAFWEGFTPAALPDQHEAGDLRTVFLVEDDWSRVTATIAQDGTTARVTAAGHGNLDVAAAQAARFLSLDVDGRGWPAVGDRDPVIAAAQARLPGLRPCGFHSPYEAAAWAVLSQRIRITQAARLRDDLIRRHGNNGAFPHPQPAAHTRPRPTRPQTRIPARGGRSRSRRRAERQSTARPRRRHSHRTGTGGQRARTVRRRTRGHPRRQPPRQPSPPRGAARR